MIQGTVHQSLCIQQVREVAATGPPVIASVFRFGGCPSLGSARANKAVPRFLPWHLGKIGLIIDHDHGLRKSLCGMQLVTKEVLGGRGHYFDPFGAIRKTAPPEAGPRDPSNNRS